MRRRWMKHIGSKAENVCVVLVVFVKVSCTRKVLGSSHSPPSEVIGIRITLCVLKL